MQVLQHSYRGLSLIMELNWDLILYLATIAIALMVGAWMLSFV
ncbi:MAG: hypothetical protein QNK42_11005 [Pseudodonghicola sp.]|nr:hypothetical protein [Pseudodonghicola sp.]